jgi:hypothetical protein
MDDVEALRAIERPQAQRGARERPGPWPEREQLDLEVVAPAERLDLIAHERTQPGPLARRVHVRDDEDAHRANTRGTCPCGRRP